ncbi:NnrU family protein [Pelagibacterium limicola]|uniref:NnrU family protein n=1 Tax=Pelagibacterium limicola TaxID=2791022 RepID=UPI0018AFB3F8|nr:NnrU family protein [Pelagibacterium limicola]
MWVLIVGLVLFLAIHSVRIVAPGWRDAQLVARPGTYKGAYATLSAVGLVMIVVGYAMARPESGFVFSPPGWGRHLAGLLTVLGFVGIAAAYVPTGRIKATLRHPMLIGVMLWALGHLLVNGDLVSLILFGAFLIWTVADLVSLSRRDDPAPVAGPVLNDVIAIVLGVALALIFAFWLHGPLIGIAPYG